MNNPYVWYNYSLAHLEKYLLPTWPTFVLKHRLVVDAILSGTSPYCHVVYFLISEYLKKTVELYE